MLREGLRAVDNTGGVHTHVHPRCDELFVEETAGDFSRRHHVWVGGNEPSWWRDGQETLEVLCAEIVDVKG